MGRIVSLGEAAESLGFSIETVRTWTNLGMPIIERGGKGRAWKVDLGEVLRWRERQAAEDARAGFDPNTGRNEEKLLRRRKMVADTESIELDLALKRGEIGFLRDFHSALAEMITSARAHLLAIPSQYAQQAFACRSVPDVKLLLEKAIRDALEELSEHGYDPL